MDPYRKQRSEPNRRIGRLAPATPMTAGARRRKLALRILGWSVVGGLVAIALTAVGLALIFWHYSHGLPNIKNLGDYKPKQVTVIQDRDGDRIGEIYTERRTFVPYEEVPKMMVDAFVVAEDADFFNHGGIDYRGMIRAAFTNLRSGRTRHGASTITQQVVKNFVLSPERTFKRKIQEIILARRLESALTKKEILTLYMNQIYFGGGRYGVQEAARFYFGKDVQKLDVGEMALLAGLPQAPEDISPHKNPTRAKDRQIYVLNQLVRHGKLSAAEARTWIDKPIAVVRKPYPMLDSAPEWLELVRQELVVEYGTDLDTLGTTVRTTLRGAAEAGLGARGQQRRHRRRRQRLGTAQGQGGERDPRQVLDQLEAEEGLLEVRAPGQHAVAAEQHGVDLLAPGRERGDRGLARRREGQARDDRPERHHGLGDERPADHVVADPAARARDRGGVGWMGVDHRADIGAALVDREVEAELAEDLAGADHLAGGIELEQIAVADHPLGRGGRRGEEARAVADGEVAVVVGDPAAGVELAGGGGDPRAQAGVDHGALPAPV